jgi:hypothetical protein
VAPRVPRRRGCASASSYGFWPFTEFPEVACPSSCATALATRDPGRNRSNMTLDRDQSRIGADVRAVRPHNLLPNCLDRCSFCAPCLWSCQQIRATRLRHPCCGQATVAAAKKSPHSTRGPGTKGNSRCSYRSHVRQLGAALLRPTKGRSVACCNSMRDQSSAEQTRHWSARFWFTAPNSSIA